MRRIVRSALTEAAPRVDAGELEGEVNDRPEALWARLRAFEHALPQLLEQALRHLLDEELRLDPGHVRHTARALVERVESEHGPFVLRVHPDDRPLLEALPQTLTLEDDPSLQRGGCVLTSPNVQLDASLPTRLDRVLRALRQ